MCLDERDFAPIVDVNRFPASTGSSTPRKFCFNIAIMTDKIYEDDEAFTVILKHVESIKFGFIGSTQIVQKS